MKDLISKYNRNRKKIWAYISIIIGIIIIVQIVNYVYSYNSKKEQEELNQNQDSNIVNNIEEIPKTSEITGEKISNKQSEDIDQIEIFFEYLENEEIDKAYNLLGKDCKQNLYRDKDIFYEAYVQKIKTQYTASVEIENWINDIYKVSIYNSPISTGELNERDVYQDYISIIEEDNQVKLNINSFIKSDNVINSGETENIKIEVLEVDKYIDFEIYTFKITNKSDDMLAIGETSDTDAFYITDEHGIKYEAYIHELTQSELTLNPRETRTIEIKYYNRYSSTKNIVAINFSRIILNYDNYEKLENKLYFTSFDELVI